MSDWFFVLAFTGFGAVFIAVGVHRYRVGRAFLASAHRVPGIVAGTHTVETINSYEYFPVLRFRTIDGADIETVGQTTAGSLELTRLRGRQVEVLYDPRDPREARMNTSSGRALTGAVGMVAGGCVFAAIGIALLLTSLT